jgi:hypothetical protein
MELWLSLIEESKGERNGQTTHQTSRAGGSIA